jgi:hypothetical protein
LPSFRDAPSRQIAKLFRPEGAGFDVQLHIRESISPLAVLMNGFPGSQLTLRPGMTRRKLSAQRVKRSNSD